MTKKSKTYTPIIREEIEKAMPLKEELSKYMDNCINRNFDMMIKRLNLSGEEKREFIKFSEKSKPTVKKSIIRQFEMELEVKTADIEARQSGLLADKEAIFDSILSKKN